MERAGFQLFALKHAHITMCTCSYPNLQLEDLGTSWNGELYDSAVEQGLCQQSPTLPCSSKPLLNQRIIYWSPAELTRLDDNAVIIKRLGGWILLGLKSVLNGILTESVYVSIYFLKLGCVPRDANCKCNLLHRFYCKLPIQHINPLNFSPLSL